LPPHVCVVFTAEDYLHRASVEDVIYEYKLLSDHEAQLQAEAMGRMPEEDVRQLLLTRFVGMADCSTESGISDQGLRSSPVEIAAWASAATVKVQKLGKFEDLDIMGTRVGSPFDWQAMYRFFRALVCGE
jgi:hypothetical protein